MAIKALAHGQDRERIFAAHDGFWRLAARHFHWSTDITFDKFSGGYLNFVGRGRWGDNPDAFPEIIDGGPADRYAAGNFYFEPLNEEPNVVISPVDDDSVRLNWTGVGVLNSSGNVAGP